MYVLECRVSSPLLFLYYWYSMTCKKCTFLYIFCIHILLYTCTIIQVIRYLILKSKGMDTVNPNEGFLKINRILSNRCVRRVFQVLNKHAPIENTDSFDRPGVIIIVDVLVFSR